MEAIWQYREKKHDLVGTTINIHNGQWHRKGESCLHNNEKGLWVMPENAHILSFNGRNILIEIYAYTDRVTVTI